MKTIIMISLLISQNTFAYEFLAKLECKKTLADHRFVYFEVAPANLYGQQFSLFLYDANRQMMSQQKFTVIPNLDGEKMVYEGTEGTITMDVTPDGARDGNTYMTHLKLNQAKNFPKELTVLCDYFVPTDEKSKSDRH